MQIVKQTSRPDCFLLKKNNRCKHKAFYKVFRYCKILSNCKYVSVKETYLIKILFVCSDSSEDLSLKTK